jgi:hypothetical protein
VEEGEGEGGWRRVRVRGGWRRGGEGVRGWRVREGGGG